MRSFFEHAPRLAAPDYIPTYEDILRAPTKSTAPLLESSFHLGLLTIVTFEINVPRWPGLRRKLPQLFAGVTSIIYCTALSEYDAVTHGQYHLKDSLAVFESVVTSPWFARTAVLLAFTKPDVFAAKLPTVPLETVCPEYTGGFDVAAATKFIQRAFLRCNRAPLPVYPVVMQATDPSYEFYTQMDIMIRDTLLRNVLRDCKLID
ncbi:hypothetical protein BV25DRAFT_1821216 [Artomyces pyxidatus]|uniref:Uncharacterized protein n=1 Tax=Artomyces pyxidatus TaxID=48021 RepID=A0ACB8TCR0_9AGAM|nr:hypothetical protein BV25DRAFT_1821216 [Artomyces pyxidatus]